MGCVCVWEGGRGDGFQCCLQAYRSSCGHSVALLMTAACVSVLCITVLCSVYVKPVIVAVL